MLTLQVALAERSYPILIGQSVLGRGELLARHLQARDLLLVSNTTGLPPNTAIASVIILSIDS